VDFSDEVEGVEDIGVGRTAGFYSVKCWLVEDVWDLAFPVSLEAFKVT